MMKALLFLVTSVFTILPYHSDHFNIFNLESHPEKSDKYIKVSAKNVDETAYRIKKVVIDAGHGGRDAGCSGHHSQEKHIALKIALKLGRLIQHNYPNVEVIYTRSTDVFVPLHKRAAIANNHQADLFMSIHCNALPSHPSVDGSETYVLGLHRAEENLAVAKRENASILMEDNYAKQYHGYDPHSNEGHIILSMFQNVYLEQSILFAEKVESNIQSHAKRHSRGVKQAGFLVLRETTMPSVLIETGYLTNRNDNDYLLTDYGQSAIANAILQAFGEYKYEIEYTESNPILAKNRTMRSVQASTPKQIKRPSNPPSDSYSVTESPRQQAKGFKRGSKIKSLMPPQGSATTKSNASIQYKVLLASTNKLVDTKKAPWSNVNYSVQVKKEKDTFKYYVIGFKNYKEASTVKKEMRASGFKEAFVVAFKNGKRVKIK